MVLLRLDLSKFSEIYINNQLFLGVNMEQSEDRGAETSDIQASESSEQTRLTEEPVKEVVQPEVKPFEEKKVEEKKEEPKVEKKVEVPVIKEEPKHEEKHIHHKHHVHKERKKINLNVKEIYKHKYKQLLWIPAILLILALVQISVQTAMTGDFVNKGISLKGGTTITIPEKTYDAKELQHFITSKFNNMDVNVRALTRGGRNIGLIVESDIQSYEDIDSLVSAIGEKTGGLTKDDYSIEQMGPSLGASFFKETFRAIIFAFIFMAIVVFYYFRLPAPSLAVILAAFSDIVVTVAIFNLLGFKLSTAGVAAFLMLIGYSVDTDILLSTRVLKRRRGSVLDRVYNSMKTGLTMSATTISAVVIALIFTQSEVLREIMIILFIGLLVDLINTWIQNAGLLRWYCEKKRIH